MLVAVVDGGGECRWSCVGVVVSSCVGFGGESVTLEGEGCWLRLWMVVMMVMLKVDGGGVGREQLNWLDVHYLTLLSIQVLSKTPDSAHRIFRLAAEYGAFRIGGCGFFGD
ncbi:hypothetical protein ACFE04_008239 [Oxalis oulophora]